MLTKTLLATALLLGLVVSCIAQEAPDSKPVELELLNASIGVWDALIEIWPAGSGFTLKHNHGCGNQPPLRRVLDRIRLRF
jgi:hypothetical protein